MYRNKATRAIMGLLLASAMFGTSGGASAAETHEVGVKKGPSFDPFDPKQVWGEVGDTVKWTYDGGASRHNVRQKNFLFRNEPSGDAWTFTRVFSAGSFPYMCEVHPWMKGTIKMPVTVHPDYDGDLPRVQWATTDSNTGRVTDVQFRVGRTGKWKNWKKDTKRNGAVFGKGGKPVPLAKKTYWFKARSQKKGKTSKWSPLESYFHDKGGYGY